MSESNFNVKLIVVNENGSEYEGNIGSFSGLNVIVDNNCQNCIIKLHKPIKFGAGCTIDLKGTNTYIELETSRFNYNFHIQTTNSDNQSLYIGKNCSTWSNFHIHLTEDDAKVYIGNDCMFSKNIEIWASDGHAIVDIEKSNVINVSKKGVIIGDRVWISSNVILTKNVIIGNDSVIGAGSVVSNSFYENNIVIAGNPAKVIKNNIRWYRGKPNKIQNDLNKNVSKSSKIIAVIPSRYGSSRYPGKPLAQILGKPMIQWVYERVLEVSEISDVYVATDDERIYNSVIGFGGKAVMTGECSCGTDRVYQVCKDIDCNIVLNIQGDEPMIKPEMIRDLISAFDDPDVKMATLKKEIVNESDINNPNIAKLITDSDRNAIYFSRSTVPYNRDGKSIKYFKHIGIYGYKKTFLKEFVSLPKSMLEEVEQLEQLRAIENGHKIRVIETQHQSIGVDIPEHISIVEAELKRELGL